MFGKILTSVALILTITAKAQITCSPMDSTLFQLKMDGFKFIEASSRGDSIVAVGKSFLDIPYAEKTLEVGTNETLVINLRGLDCTTFVENVLAFGLLLKHGQTNFGSFAENLKTIRYRNGELNGYPSRLHYFTEWIRNNQSKGLVTNITAELGGIVHQKPINFMGTHRALYPHLKQDENYNAILQIEAQLVKQNLCILPQNQIESNEHLIQSGDIIAFATSIKGLDVTHTGIAVRQNGKIHLLHASTSGSVRISKEPLREYLKKIKSNIGIIVARPQ